MMQTFPKSLSDILYPPPVAEVLFRDSRGSLIARQNPAQGILSKKK
jgi:hypothetical protein